MCVYVCVYSGSKFQISSIILAGFRQKGVNFIPRPLAHKHTHTIKRLKVHSD